MTADPFQSSIIVTLDADVVRREVRRFLDEDVGSRRRDHGLGRPRLRAGPPAPSSRASPASSPGLDIARAVFGELDPELAVERGHCGRAPRPKPAPRSPACTGARRRSSPASVSRSTCSSACRASRPLTRRYVGRGRGNRRVRVGHAKDDARPPAVREIRRAGRRRAKPPDRALRRRPDQGQSHRGRGRRCGRR